MPLARENDHQADHTLKNFIPEVIAGDADKSFADAPADRRRSRVLPSNSDPIELMPRSPNGRRQAHNSRRHAERGGHPARPRGRARIDSRQVQIISPYACGGFGQKNSLADGRRSWRGCRASSSGRSSLWFHGPRSFMTRAPGGERSACGLAPIRSGQMLAAIHESMHRPRAMISCPPSSRRVVVGSTHRKFSCHERLVRTDVQTRAICAHPSNTVHALPWILCRRTGVRAWKGSRGAAGLANDTKRSIRSRSGPSRLGICSAC